MKNWANNPTQAAEQLHEWLGWTSPSDFTLNEIANALGLFVQEVSSMASEGRILIKGDRGILSLNNKITLQGKRNFVIAHEIGHFLLHKTITVLFSDTNQTLSDWYKKGKQEQEANEFAAELLMPTNLFRQLVLGRKLTISLVEELATFFGVSITAAFLQYVKLGSYPIMVIYVEDGKVTWKRCSDDFPFKYLPLQSKVSPWSVAGNYFLHHNLEPNPEEVDAIEWFPEDYRINYQKGAKLWEQCFQVSTNGLISCLWTN